ncbi:hypothetical protein [Natrinema thermotolerans]|uniref:hypothetical protein n=1 Tax=Natrinema thermotolerans TaxID=121872 RepID=UPI00067890D6|nr:hypothetical protein [Natrinema thermotolerans]QCC57209.1 hypothetical protein DVR14_00620 [Natrinema thermotolerans]
MLDLLDPIVVEPDETAARIREYGRQNPDLRKNRYDGTDGTVEGMCYALAEAYYFARGGKTSGLEVYCLSWADVRPDGAGTHWYLRDPERGVWIDLGLERAADGTHIPYGEGRSRAWMTGYEPSKRAVRILEDLGIGVSDS